MRTEIVFFEGTGMSMIGTQRSLIILIPIIITLYLVYYHYLQLTTTQLFYLILISSIILTSVYATQNPSSLSTQIAYCVIVTFCIYVIVLSFLYTLNITNLKNSFLVMFWMLFMSIIIAILLWNGPQFYKNPKRENPFKIIALIILFGIIIYGLLWTLLINVK